MFGLQQKETHEIENQQSENGVLPRDIDSGSFSDGSGSAGAGARSGEAGRDINAEKGGRRRHNDLRTGSGQNEFGHDRVRTTGVAEGAERRTETIRADARDRSQAGSGEAGAYCPKEQYH